MAARPVARRRARRRHPAGSRRWWAVALVLLVPLAFPLYDSDSDGGCTAGGRGEGRRRSSERRRTWASWLRGRAPDGPSSPSCALLALKRPRLRLRRHRLDPLEAACASISGERPTTTGYDASRLRASALLPVSPPMSASRRPGARSSALRSGRTTDGLAEPSRHSARPGVGDRAAGSRGRSVTCATASSPVRRGSRCGPGRLKQDHKGTRRDPRWHLPPRRARDRCRARARRRHERPVPPGLLGLGAQPSDEGGVGEVVEGWDVEAQPHQVCLRIATAIASQSAR
jgi:hypothetical protein